MKEVDLREMKMVIKPFCEVEPESSRKETVMRSTLGLVAWQVNSRLMDAAPSHRSRCSRYSKGTRIEVGGKCCK